MKKIIIDSRVVQHLGKDLITSSDVAVTELVKNSIDAKATTVNLRLYSNSCPNHNQIDAITLELVPGKYFQEPYLVIEDDGKGMTDDELEKGFLTIGTNIKANDGTTLGEKGIGRLAVQRLGVALLVETCSETENHTSYVYIDWEEVVKGKKEVLSIEGRKTQHHTKLWIFGVNLEDYVENAIQFSQMSLFSEHSNIYVNRDLKSALDFLVSPFSYNYMNNKININFVFDDNPVEVGFPMDMLSLSESKHYFDLNTDGGFKLNYGLNIQPWYIERVHRALVKAEAFKRLKKSHLYYAELLNKNLKRIENVLTGTLNRTELSQRLYQVYSDFYIMKDDKKDSDIYASYIDSKVYKILDELAKITPISGEIFSFKQGAAIGDNIIIDAAVALNKTQKRYTLNELKRFLEDYNGVKLYRGFYRIGSLGNKENDWIKLQQFRTKGQQWYRFDLGNTIGVVTLSDDTQSYIQEISSRLDISENITSEAFKHLINIVFNYMFYELNKKANDIIRILLDEEGLLEENLAKRVKKNNSDIKAMMARNRAIQKALDDLSQHFSENAQIVDDKVIFPKKSYQFVTDTLGSISQDVKKDQSAQESTALLLSEADAQLKAIEVESYNNYKLMANGLITETITHELHSLSKTGIIPDSQQHFDALKDYFIQSEAVKTYNQHVYPIQNSYDMISGKLRKVGDLYSFLETTFIKKGAYDCFINQNIQMAIDDIKKNLLDVMQKQNINIICETGDLTWTVPKGVLLHVFYNLINNSIYWIDTRKKWALKDETYLSNYDDYIMINVHGVDGLIIYDTGTGVSKNMEDLLFEPLQSGKPYSEGRGMGLYIVRKLLQSFGGEIELLDERNEYGNRYKFLVLANTEEE